MSEALNALLALAEANPAHLLAFVHANDRVFLDPDVVGPVGAPLVQQFGSFLRKQPPSAAAADDIEKALRTGIVEGAAAGNESDDDDGGGDDIVPVAWRDDPCDAWAATLESAACKSTCVFTPDGRCIGPLPIMEWLTAHLPDTLKLLKHHVQGAALKRAAPAAEGAPPDAADAAELLLRVAGSFAAALGGRVSHELQGSEPSSAALRGLLPRLLLVLHFLGEQPEAWAAAADGRANGLAVACAAARALALAAREQADAGLLTELQALAFIGHALVEQDAAAASRQGAPLQPEDEAWQGDEEARDGSAALLQLSVSLSEPSVVDGVY